MRGRKLDANGDMLLGHGRADYWINDRRGVGQVVQTRLSLWRGQWFLNTQDGTPWATQVLGKYTDNTRDEAILNRIYGTPGVVNVTAYSSVLARQARAWTVHANISSRSPTFRAPAAMRTTATSRMRTASRGIA